MTTYGLRCYDSTGNIIIDITDSVTRVLHTSIVDSTASGSITVTDDENSNIIGFAYTLDNRSIPHTLVEDSNNISGGIQTSIWDYDPKSLSSSDLSFPAGRSKIIIIGY